MSVVELGERFGVDQLLAGHPAEDDIEPSGGGGVDDVEERFKELELARPEVGMLRSALAEDGSSRLRVTTIPTRRPRSRSPCRRPMTRTA